MRQARPNALTNASLLLIIYCIRLPYMERVTGMTTDKLVAVLRVATIGPSAAIGPSLGGVFAAVSGARLFTNAPHLSPQRRSDSGR